MKKELLCLLLIASSVVCLTSCLTNGDDDSTPIAYVKSNVYMLNAGNMYSGVSGSLTTYNFDVLDTTLVTTTENAFNAVNGRTLGGTPNDAVILGTKMYIAVTGENSIEIVDKNSLSSLGRINTVAVLGADKGASPRRLAAAYGNVYFTTYGGYVCKIDTTNYAMTATMESGSYPEAVALSDSYIYVANSDYAQGNNATISQIDKNTQQKVDIKEGVVNPTELATCNNCMFVIDGSTYNDDYSYKTQCDSLGVINGRKVTHLHHCTYMASMNGSSYGTRLYCIYAPYGGTPEYFTYTPYGATNVTGGLKKTFITNGPKYPCSIGVDPYTGYVYIGAFSEKADGTGADYNAKGSVYVYTYNGDFKMKLTAGVDPVRLVINRTIVYY